MCTESPALLLELVDSLPMGHLSFKMKGNGKGNFRVN